MFDEEHIAHTPEDYSIFEADGSYLQVWAGIECKGKWEYLEASNEIIIYCDPKFRIAMHNPRLKM